MKVNAAAIADALKSIRTDNIGLCHIINEVTKAANNSELLQGAKQSVEKRAKSEMLNLVDKVGEVKELNEQQGVLKETQLTILTSLREKIGAA